MASSIAGGMNDLKWDRHERKLLHISVYLFREKGR